MLCQRDDLRDWSDIYNEGDRPYLDFFGLYLEILSSEFVSFLHKYYVLMRFFF